MKNRTPVRSDPPAPNEPSPVPAFTPVPRRKPRHDGWTAARQRAFIEALAQTGSVSHAAARVNMAAEGAYQLRRAPGSESFRAAWAAALDYGVQHLADLAIDRARDGVAVPIFHDGKQVGEKRWYNDRLLMFILRHHMPARYGTNIGGGTRSKATIEREAAENCPTCRAAREAKEDAGSDKAANAWLDEMMKRYLIKVCQEQDERRAGRWYAADFYLRQLTHIELVLDMGGRCMDLIDQFTENPKGKVDGTLYASPISQELADRRATLWAARNDPPRPPLRLPRLMTDSGMRTGPTSKNRYAARAAAEARIAAAQDEWEAARSEESWREWCKGRGSGT
ncbi:hypothetical protein [Sphingomonas sp.]|uniref:hypothetical protein n=1 Tax=Sphingomonas sp. TaxID=28214 RepID=UPI0035BC7B71